MLGQVSVEYSGWNLVAAGQLTHKQVTAKVPNHLLTWPNTQVRYLGMCHTSRAAQIVVFRTNQPGPGKDTLKKHKPTYFSSPLLHLLCKSTLSSGNLYVKWLHSHQPTAWFTEQRHTLVHLRICYTVACHSLQLPNFPACSQALHHLATKALQMLMMRCCAQGNPDQTKLLDVPA